MRIFTFLLFLLLNFQAIGEIIPSDEIHKLKESVPSNKRIQILESIVSKTYRKFPDTAFYYAEQLKHIAIKEKDYNVLANTFWYLANVYKQQGNFNEAVNCLFESNRIYKSLNKKLSVAITYYSIGQLFNSGRDYKNGLLYFRNAISLYSELNKTLDIAQTHYEMARCHIKLTEFDSSIYHLNQALQLIDKKQNQSLVSKIHNNLGSTYFQLEDYDQAISYYLRSLHYAEGLKDYKKKAAIAYNNIGEAHLYNGKLYKAETYLLRALKTKKELGRPDFTLSTIVLLGKLKVKQQKYAEGLAYLEDGIQAASHDIVNHNLMDALNEVEIINELSKDFQIPEAQIQQYFRLQNKQANLLVKFSDNLEGLNSQYILKNAFETNKLTEEKELLQNRLSQTKLVVGLIIILTLLIAIVSLWYFRKYLALKNFKKETSLNLELISHQLERTIRMASKK